MNANISQQAVSGFEPGKRPALSGPDATGAGDRSAEVRKITAPTLVIHGKDDPLVPLKNGEDTAQKIAGSEYTEIDGMGHDLGVLPVLIERILPFLRNHTPV